MHPADADNCVWNLAKPTEEPRRFPAPDVRWLRFSPDGKALAWGSWDSAVTLIDPATGKDLHPREAHLGPVRSVVWSRRRSADRHRQRRSHGPAVGCPQRRLAACFPRPYQCAESRGPVPRWPLARLRQRGRNCYSLGHGRWQEEVSTAQSSRGVCRAILAGR